MQNAHALRGKLQSIDGKDYGAYQSLIGAYAYPQFKLLIDQIPKDPYAPPHTGIYRIQISCDYVVMPEGLKESKIKETAFADFLNRRFFQASARFSKVRRGTGYSGIITIAEPGQTILQRNTIIIYDDFIEVRFFIGLPASGRNIRSTIAEEMLFEELPQIVAEALFKENIETETLSRHIETAEDAEYLRGQLKSRGLVAFIADGAILPRESGTSDQPLDQASAVPFISPERLRVEIELPHAGLVQVSIP